MNKHEQVRKDLQKFHECFYDDSKHNTAELKRNKIDNYINEAEATEKELEEYKISDASKEQSSIEYFNLYKEMKKERDIWRDKYHGENQGKLELQQDIGVLLRVLDAPSDDPEATYILDQIIIKLLKGGVENA